MTDVVNEGELSKMALLKGDYFLIERSKVDELYSQAGYPHSDEEVPNFIKIGDKDCLFTENFIEKDGKEYEIVMVSNGFSWEDILTYEEELED